MNQEEIIIKTKVKLIRDNQKKSKINEENLNNIKK